MSLLAHAIGFRTKAEARKKTLDREIQHEISEAKRIQRETGCTWSEALRIAGKWEKQVAK